MSQALSALTPVLWVVLGIFLIALVFLIAQFMLRPSKRVNLPNAPLAVKAKPLMTDAERAFFHTLRSAVGNRYEIFPQIAFSNLVSQTATLPPNVWGIVQNSHADFALAHPKYLGTVVVIELDDSSHEQATTRAKDEIKNRICADANIPLLRFRIGDKWDAEAIRLQVEQIVNGNK